MATLRRTALGLVFVALGLCAGVLLNQYGFVYERFRIEVTTQELRDSIEFNRYKVRACGGQVMHAYMDQSLSRQPLQWLTTKTINDENDCKF